MKSIKHDLILKKDTIFNESIKVDGDIEGNYNLKVLGDIHCENIDCWGIDCRNIDCENIDCWNIICCEKLTKKNKKNIIKAKKLIQNRSKLKQKVWK